MTESNKNKLFKEWVNEFSDGLYSWAYFKTSNKELAEDLVQETFLSAYKGIENFKNESQPKTWLFRILNNKIIDYYRKAATQKEQNIDNETAINSLFDDKNHWNSTINFSLEEEENLLDNTEFIETLNNCINKLPSNWRIAIESKYQNDIKAQDICKDLNITQSNYWQIIHRAKLQLKICIEKNWNT